MAEVKESKDQRRARLNREGKEFLKTGQEHLVTEQHRNAMEYFKRKDTAKNERRRVEASVGAGEVTKRATGESTPSTGSTAQMPIPGEKRDRIYSKLSKQIKSMGEDNPRLEGYASALSPKVRSIKLGAINEDDTHHAAMATIADHLSDKLEEADVKGILHSKDSTHIDSALGQAYASIHRSNTSHNSGQVNDAKVHMESAAQNLHSAATQMAAKGVSLHPKILEAIKQSSQGYVSSTIAGTGAMPHPTFQPPKAKSNTMGTVPTGPKRLDASKISGDPLRSGEDTAWSDDSTFEPRRNEGNELMSRQIKDSLGY